MNITKLKQKITTKRFFIGIAAIIVILIIVGIVKSKNGEPEYSSAKLETRDLERTSLVSGQATSEIDLKLSFRSGGIVRTITAKVGDKVTAGQIIASLDQRDLQATLTSARGALASANANYNRIVQGASNEEIVIAQKAVDAAAATLQNAENSLTATKTQQDALVTNARISLYSNLTAVSSSNNPNTAPTISGVYNSETTGTIIVTSYATQSAGSYISYSGIVSGSFPLSLNVPTPLGNSGLYLTFSSITSAGVGSWTINIPDNNSSSYIANLNAYNAALQTRNVAVLAAEAAVTNANIALGQAQAQLDLKRAQARPVELEAARAQILSATGQVQAAQAAMENTIIRAPVAGTLTSVDIRIGEQATPLQEVVVLQDVGNLRLEANVGEASIRQITEGQSAEVTFDALVNEKYQATVLFVDPSSNLVSGVVNYKVTLDIVADEKIKPGMSANITIKTGERKSVLAVPQRAVVARDGKKYVRVVADAQNKVLQEVEVQTGMEADGGMIEILSGVNAGAEVVTSAPAIQ